MKLETLKLSELNPAKYNPRTITKEEFEGLKESLNTFGQQENLIVNKDMTVISGHQRLEAMKALGWTEAVCNMVDLDKHAEKKLNVIMNSTAISGKYDDLKLSEILEELKLDDDYESLRLDKLEPLDLSDVEVEEDEAPEVSSEPPVSQLGVVYQLGRHRVMCGDSTDNASVIELLNGTSPRVCLTDPPYGLGEKKKSGKNDYSQYEDTEANLKELAEKWLPIAKEVCQTVVFSPGINNVYLYPKADWVMCWFYGGGQLKSSWGFNCWQPFLCYGKDPSFSAQKGARPDAVDMNVPANAQDVDHPCPKPVKLMAWFLDRLVFDNTPVYEPFCGGGSTLIACEQTDRTCYGMELDEKYLDVIRKRWAKYVYPDRWEKEWEILTPAIAK